VIFQTEQGKVNINVYFKDETLWLTQKLIANINSEDIDSGPIILGFGSVATIMNAKAMATLDIKGAKSTWSFLNFIGLPINLFGKKYYLLGKEPIYDIFLLWIAVDLI